VCAAARIGRGTDQQRATRNTQILSLFSSTEAYKFHAVSQRFQWIMLRIAVQERFFFHLKKNVAVRYAHAILFRDTE
jgi:hypothetical protein